MNIYSKTEAKDWCTRNGIILDDAGYPKIREGSIEFKIPVDAGQRIALVKKHMNEQRAKGEIMVWFTAWSVWPSGEVMHIFKRLRMSYGDNRELIDYPAHVFNSNEYAGQGYSSWRTKENHQRPLQNRIL